MYTHLYISRMKRRLIILSTLLSALLITCWIMGQSSWHLDRNRYNALPEGKLTLVKDSLYEDAGGREWILLPASMNAFHQPDHPVAAPARPYGDAVTSIPYDKDNPNLKFLSMTGEGGSLEAILQPDGTYLTTGPQQGTYNYGHPAGFWGIARHTVWDVLPHFANGAYRAAGPARR